MNTSVIICFYERLKYLKQCLDSLRFNADDFDEVVIADDGSSRDVVEGLEQILHQYDFPIIHAWQPREGARRAACRNNGIRTAKGDYLVFIDGDFLVLPGMIRAHVSAAKERTFAAGRCKYLPEEATRTVFAQDVTPPLLERLYGELDEKPIKREHREFIKYTILRKLGLAGIRKVTFGGHYSAFRKDIERINGYDENYVGWGGEDQDLALRMVKAGMRGRSVIRTARTLHMWHPREMGDKHWKEGPNVEYFNRDDIPVFCENGLLRKGRQV